MLTLLKSDLLEFQKRTMHIRKNTLLPILAYLRLDWRDGRHWMTKSNAQTVCVAPIGGIAQLDYRTLLLDERILFAVLPAIKGEYVQIQVNPTQVSLSDGEKMVVDFAREDPTNFPNTPDPNTAGDVLPLTAAHLQAIQIAKSFILDSETAANFQFVHIGGIGIRGYHNSYFYVNASFQNLPTIQLGMEEADLVSEAGVGSLLSQSDRHIFLVDGEIRYIFTRHEVSSPATESVLNKLRLPGKNFQMQKADFLDFCNLANVVSETPIADCALEPNGGMFAKLKMLDINYSRSASKEIMATGEFDAFNFNSRLVATPFRAIPQEQLLAKTNQNCLIISNEAETEYFAFLGMGKK
jgi:hypothetical protein